MTYLQTLASTLPIIFLVITGIVVRVTCLVQDHTIQDLKKLIVTVTLPLLLFGVFATMTFQPTYLIIVAAVFLACIVIMLVTSRLRFLPGLTSVYSSYLMAGFEAGMLGYAIFGSIYGVENISHFAVIDLGQVLFVFFILITRLEFQQNRRLSISQTFLHFLKTPVILGILAGILANMSGLYQIFTGWALTQSLLKTAEILGGLTTPLVALAIGYELHFQKMNVWKPFQTVLARMTVWVVLALAFNFLVVRQLDLDPLFEAAILIMAILPAPFVIPLYVKEESDYQERAYIVNTLSLGTVTALVGAVLVNLMY